MDPGGSKGFLRLLAVCNLILHTHFSCLPLFAGLSLIAPAFAPDLSSYSEYRVLKNVECNHYKHNNTYMSALLEQTDFTHQHVLHYRDLQ